MPLDWPAYYPNDLISQTEKVVAEAVRKFPEQTQVTELCEFVVSTLTPDFCAAVQGKTLRAGLASYRMDNLLDCLLRYNCDDLESRYRLKKKVVNSDEWKKLVDEIARVHSAGQPQGQPGETTGHKDAKHAEQPESKKRGPKGFEGLDKSQKSRTYSDMLASAGLTKMQFDCASLAWEHGLLVKEVAARVRRHRRTVHGHLQNATKKIQMARLKEGSAKKEAKTKPGSLEPGSID